MKLTKEFNYKKLPKKKVVNLKDGYLWMIVVDNRDEEEE